MKLMQHTEIGEGTEEIKEIKDELVKRAYDEGLVNGYLQARQLFRSSEERKKLEKADEELIEFWVDTIIIAAIGIAIVLTISGIGYL